MPASALQGAITKRQFGGCASGASLPTSKQRELNHDETDKMSRVVRSALGRRARSRMRCASFRRTGASFALAEIIIRWGARANWRNKGPNRRVRHPFPNWRGMASDADDHDQ